MPRDNHHSLRTMKAVGALYGFIGAAVFFALAHATPVVAQNVKEFIVRLQDTTPGLPQVGNSNITGTAIAGQFQGGGAGLTAVDAAKFGGKTPEEFGTGVKIPFKVSMPGYGPQMFTMSTLDGPGSVGVEGALGYWAGGYGVYGYSNHPDGYAIRAEGRNGGSGGSGGILATSERIAVHGIGTMIGVYGSGSLGGSFSSTADNQPGVLGTGFYGALGYSDRPDGKGVWGEATGPYLFSGSYGGYFKATQPGTTGVLGYATSGTGTTYAGSFLSLSSSGYGVKAEGNTAVWAKSPNLALWADGPSSFSGIAAFNGGLRVPAGAQPGLVLTSDANGVATWQAASGGTYSAGAGLSLVGDVFSVATLGITDSMVSGVDWSKITGTPNTLLALPFDGSVANGNGAAFNVTNTAADSSAIAGTASAGSGVGVGVQGQTSASAGTGVYGLASATVGATFGVQGVAFSPDGAGVKGKATAQIGGIGGYFESAGLAGKGVVGLATGTGGFTAGGWFEAADPLAVGIYAKNSGGGYAGQFDGGVGINGSLLVNGPFQTGGQDGFLLTSNANGMASWQQNAWRIVSNNILSETSGNVGIGIPIPNTKLDVNGTVKMTGFYLPSQNTNNYVLTSDSSGRGTWKPSAWVPVPGGISYNGGTVYVGNSESPRKIDLRGSLDVDQVKIKGGAGAGKVLTCFSADGTAAWQNADSVSLPFSGTVANDGDAFFVRNTGNGQGIVGRTDGATNIGVLGISSDQGGEAWGLYSFGNFGANGLKLFRIDHPFDPENRYLNHFCSESSEPVNFYRGTVITDAKGYATAHLPAYFSEVNKDPQISLTVVDDSDDFVLAKVTNEVQGNKFRIRTNKPGVKVYWLVHASRNDLYVRAHPPKDEVMKAPADRGKYQSPELYGQPAERGQFYQPPTQSGKGRRP